MFDVQAIEHMLKKAGWFPSMLLLGEWIFVPIIFMVLLYHFFLYIIKITRKN
ncbi:hypothetical protein [Crassaminicella profunda]|uniref:hypothetical protein n=1 Tax=Crassaminicella profunda TaxID=1286698 RepID=UPI001CA74CF3|nr:hypothetical protein [Crassaminicella profunda]QZY54172.1 hypothetical protein K7H06_14110 [Crassaminicella profunda]